MPGALPDDAYRLLDPPQQVLKGGIARDLGDPHGKRNLLTAGAVEPAFSVPALGEVGEGVRRRSRKAEALGQHPGDVADGDEVRRVRPSRPRQPPGNLKRPRRRGDARRRKCVQHPDQVLAGRAVEDRHQMRRHVGTEDLGGDLGVGSAARVGEQTGVVGLRRSLGVDPEAIAKPHRGEGAVQPVLERKAMAQVGGQTQRRDQLRGADSLDVRWITRHSPRVNG